jgi:hypothetical protein
MPYFWAILVYVRFIEKGTVTFSPALMGGGLGSHAQLVGGIWVTFSRARVARLQLTNAIVSTASQSSLFLLINLLCAVNKDCGEVRG